MDEEVRCHWLHWLSIIGEWRNTWRTLQLMRENTHALQLIYTFIHASRDEVYEIRLNNWLRTSLFQPALVSCHQQTTQLSKWHKWVIPSIFNQSSFNLECFVTRWKSAVFNVPSCACFQSCIMHPVHRWKDVPDLCRGCRMPVRRNNSASCTLVPCPILPEKLASLARLHAKWIGWFVTYRYRNNWEVLH